MYESNASLDGYWNLPDCEIKLPGRLKINHTSQEIVLHIFSEININGKQITFNRPRHDDHPSFDIILGNTHTKLTLLHCTFKKIEFIGTKLFELEYLVQFVFFGIWVVKPENLIVNKVRLKFPYISSFYDGWDYHKRQIRENLQDFNGREELKVRDDFSIKFEDRQRNSEISNNGIFKTRLDKLIEFKYNEGIAFLSLKSDCYKFSKLLEFNTRERVCYDILTVNINKKSLKSFDENYGEHPNEIIVYVQNYSEKKDFDVNKDGLPEGRMFFSCWSESKEQINNIIMKWFSNIEIFPLYEFYIDTNEWFKGKGIILSNVMYNNKFLNLIQGLESYYDFVGIENIDKITNEEFTKNRQLLLNSLESESLKKWTRKYLKFPRKILLENKLHTLVFRYNSIITNLTVNVEFLKTYPCKAKEYRNKLSHGNISKTYQGKDFEKIYTFSKLLLCIAILESLGINQNKISEMISKNINFRNELISIK